MTPQRGPSIDDPASALRQRGEALLELGRASEALLALRQAAAADPTSSRTLSLLAQALLALGSPTEAAETAQRAIACDPQSPWAHRLLTHALIADRRPTAAVRAADEVLRLAPDDPLTYHALSTALRGARRLEEAWHAAATCVRLAPQEAWAHKEHGRVELAYGELADAEVSFRRALALDARDADALNLLGAIRLRQRDWRGALPYFSDALRANPTFTAPMDNIVRSMRLSMRMTIERYWSPWMLCLLPGGLLMVGAERWYRYARLRHHLRRAVPQSALRTLDRTYRESASPAGPLVVTVIAALLLALSIAKATSGADAIPSIVGVVCSSVMLAPACLVTFRVLVARRGRRRRVRRP